MEKYRTSSRSRYDIKVSLRVGDEVSQIVTDQCGWDPASRFGSGNLPHPEYRNSGKGSFSGPCSSTVVRPPSISSSKIYNTARAKVHALQSTGFQLVVVEFCLPWDSTGGAFRRPCSEITPTTGQIKLNNTIEGIKNGSAIPSV